MWWVPASPQINPSIDLIVGHARMDLFGIAAIPPFRSCTLNARTWAEFIHGAKACWADPSLSSFLSSPHALAISLCCYWSVVLLLHVRLRGQKASFADSRPFLFLAVAHNGLLAAFSLAMCVGVTVALSRIASFDGVRATLCTPVGASMPGSLEGWLYVFYSTKYWELLDTVLLMLRGRPVTLLHLWHHSSIVVETRIWLDTGMTLGSYGMWFNSLVHVVMYAYYACALLKVRFPYKRLITLTQIVQFCTSFCFLVPFLRYHVEEKGCSGVPGLVASVFFNASYLALFLRFYFNAYSGAGERRSNKDKGD